jgi:hypothetical protein
MGPTRDGPWIRIIDHGISRLLTLQQKDEYEDICPSDGLSVYTMICDEIRPDGCSDSSRPRQQSNNMNSTTQIEDDMDDHDSIELTSERRINK